MKDKTNEELKAEAIAKAWIAEIGQFNFDRIKSNLKENGFIMWDWIRGLGHNYQSLNLWDQKLLPDKNRRDADTYIRPKSLSGIENNNGWVNINSWVDLPIFGEYDWIYQDRIIRMGFDPKKEDLEYFAKCYSHYRPIEKLKFPIF